MLTMKKDFTLEVFAENNFNILNRMINAFNRRRIRIKNLTAYEMEDDYHTGVARFILHTSAENMNKVRWQVEKFIEVERTVLHEGSEAYFNPLP
jgi:acetolactate synthase small subunit